MGGRIGTRPRWRRHCGCPRVRTCCSSPCVSPSPDTGESQERAKTSAPSARNQDKEENDVGVCSLAAVWLPRFFPGARERAARAFRRDRGAQVRKALKVPEHVSAQLLLMLAAGSVCAALPSRRPQSRRCRSRSKPGQFSCPLPSTARLPRHSSWTAVPAGLCGHRRGAKTQPGACGRPRRNWRRQRHLPHRVRDARRVPTGRFRNRHARQLLRDRSVGVTRYGRPSRCRHHRL